MNCSVLYLNSEGARHQKVVQKSVCLNFAMLIKENYIWVQSKGDPMLNSLREAMQFKFHDQLFNPLTPVPAIAGCDEPWPFFHF